MKYIISILLLAISIVSCEKENIVVEDNENTVLGFLKITPETTSYDANINIIGNDLAPSLARGAIDIDGRFKDENGQNINMDIFKVGELDMEAQSNNFYQNHLNSNHDSYNVMKNKFGDEVSIKTKDGLFPNLLFDMDLPQLMEVTVNSTNNNLSKNGFTINWTPYENDYKVGIWLRYDTRLSEQLEGLPAQYLSIVRYADDSSGEFSFSAEDLKDFPTSGWVNMYVGRARQKVITQDGKEIVINALSHQRTGDYKLIVE